MKFNNLFIILLYLLAQNVFSISNPDINKAIKKFLQQSGVIQSFSINKKVSLPSCKKELKIEKKFDSFKTLKIICPQDSEWSYNIRTKLKDDNKKLRKKRKSNNIEVSLIKLNKNLKKNHTISENDIYFEKTNKKGASNYFTNKNEVLGRKMKVFLREGQVLRERHIKKNWTIQEGQKILIENNKSKISVLIEGIALNSAMEGDYVEVLNKSTGKPINAWVKNNKKVSIFR